MEKDYKTFDDKVQTIVKSRVKLERVKFKGKMITREVIVKEWNIPKIITTDIGFQMMFGFKAPLNPKKSQSSITEVSVQHLK